MQAHPGDVVRHPGESTASFRVLCVCTGNIARSPALARLLDLATDASVGVTSAGTGALVGRPMDPPMAALLEAATGAVPVFAARAVTEDLVRDADLVVCLDAGHRRHVLELAPMAMRRTFLVRELARLADGVSDGDASSGAVPTDDAGRLRALVAAVMPYRGGLGPVEQDDVADPYRRPETAYRAAFADITEAVSTIARVADLRGRAADRTV